MSKVRQIMTADVATIDLGMSLREALEVLRGNGVSGAPVVRGNKVVGVLSATDILDVAASTPGVPTARPEGAELGGVDAPELWEEGSDGPSSYFVDYWTDAGARLTARLEASDSPEWDFLSDRDVSEALTRRVVSVEPEREIQEAARIMIEAEVHRLLVMEDGRLVGILSAQDVVRAVAERRV